MGYLLGKDSTATGWNGTIYVSTAYFKNGILYQGSDERWKDFLGDLVVNLDDVDRIPKKYYRWKSQEDGEVQIGTSAQKLAEIFPELVSTDDEGYMSVSYDRLAIVALAAIDILNKEIKEIKSKI